MARQKTCKSCKQKFNPKRPLQSCCDIPCAIAHANALKAKQQAAKAKQDRADTRERKVKLKTRSEWMKEAQAAFNAYIRARAIRFGHRCISSGVYLPADGIGGGFDAGHFKSVGSAPHLRFNLNNVWGQSKKDNMYLSGNVSEYRKGLIERRGIEVVEALEADNTSRHFDIDYLRRIKKIFTKKRKMMLSRIDI